MRKVSGSRPDGVQDKKEKTSARSLGNMEEKKRGKNEVEKQRISRKEARNQILFYSYGK